MSETYIPLHHKYRPSNFDELVGQEPIAKTLKQALTTNRIAPAYIFCGPRGTGKTSSARILARSLNCLNTEKETVNPCGSCELCKGISASTALDVIEIDAASNTGVENIRELIEKSRFAPVQARWKVYVIDECHMLSTAAFNALLKTLEEPPLKIVFVLATTDPQRVIPTILSRCQRFDFRHISLTVLIKHLAFIANKEGIEIDDNSLQLIAQRSQGGLRDAESMLDQLSLLPQPINLNSVCEFLGAIAEEDLLELCLAIVNNDPILLIKRCRDLIENGKEPMSILQGIASILRDLVIKKALPTENKLCSISDNSINKLEEIASKTELARLIEWQSQLKGLELQIKNSLQPRLWIEVLLLGLLSNSSGKVSQEAINKNRIHIDKKKEEGLVVEEKPLDEKKMINQGSKEQLVEKNKPELEEIWGKILTRINLPSTKMLLSQQAKLISISSRKVEIDIASNWVGMIESRKKIIEKAIYEALGDHREVILGTQRSVQIDNKKEIIQKQIITENKLSNQNESKNNIDEKSLNLEDKKDTNKNKEKDDTIIDEAKEFADFFNGEILNIEKDSED